MSSLLRNSTLETVFRPFPISGAFKPTLASKKPLKWGNSKRLRARIKLSPSLFQALFTLRLRPQNGTYFRATFEGFDAVKAGYLYCSNISTIGQHIESGYGLEACEKASRGRKYCSEASSGGILQIPQKERLRRKSDFLLPDFRLWNLKLQSPPKSNSISPALPCPHETPPPHKLEVGRLLLQLSSIFFLSLPWYSCLFFLSKSFFILSLSSNKFTPQAGLCQRCYAQSHTRKSCRVSSYTCHCGNASKMGQKCAEMGLVLLGKEGRSKMRLKYVKNASKMRQKCAEHLWGRTPFGRYR